MSRRSIAQTLGICSTSYVKLTGGYGTSFQAASFSAAAAPQVGGATPLSAVARLASGKKISRGLRKEGRVPGTIFSLPGEEQLLVSFRAKDIEAQFTKLGRTGWACHIFDVEVTDSERGEPKRIRALGRQVHIRADTDEIENVTLIDCPTDRTVRLAVPLRTFGEELCPGLKAGGRINRIAREVRVLTQGDHVPESFELDVSSLAVGDKLHFSDLQLPEGVTLLEDPSLPALKIMRK